MKDQPLFYDSQEDAINAAVLNCEIPFKTVAHQMWPAKKMDTAYAQLKAVVNPDKAEKLDLDEVTRLCAITGRYDPLFYLCDETHHSRPQLRAPEDERMDIMNEVQQLTQAVQQLTRRAGRLDRLED